MVKRFEKFSLNFSISQFVIFVNLPHPHPCYYLIGTFLSLYYFQVSFNLKVILSMIKITL